MRHPRLLLLLAALAAWPSGALGAPLGTAFTYQGRLTDGGSPASGNYDLQFTLKDAASGGSTVGSPVTLTNVAVSNGLFTVSLDFGAAVFVGDARWLEIGVRPGGTDPNPFTLLAGRQELTPSPNAIHSATTGDPAVQRRTVSPACASGQYVQALAADGTPTCAPDLDSGGTVTSVTAGSGLSGGTFTSSGTLAVDFSGSGSATTVSRSDHDHFGGAWSGSGVYGLAVTNSGNGTSLGGYATATTGENFGIVGRSSSPAGYGVYGWNQATSGVAAYGVFGTTSPTNGSGVYGRAPADSTLGRGVEGVAQASTGLAMGVVGASASTMGRGVFGSATATSGVTSGIHGANSSSQGRAVVGEAWSTTGTTFGVYGTTASSEGRGLYGWAKATSGTAVGVEGLSDAGSGTGVRGIATATTGTGNSYGVEGSASSPYGRGVFGSATATTGVTFGVLGFAASPTGTGVRGSGFSLGVSGSGGLYGVKGESDGGTGVYGYGGGTGVYAQGSDYGLDAIGDSVAVRAQGGSFGLYASGSAYAVYAYGNLAATGTKAFRIDHPLDPANKYLSHAAIESSDVMNLYTGNVTLDESGQATVELPEWFEALNRDFRYQLTCLGGFAPVYVAEKVSGNRFKIAGGSAGLEVSWQITGVRNDAYMKAHPFEVEQEKPAGERGTYVHAVEHGQPEDKGFDFAQRKRMEAIEANHKPGGAPPPRNDRP